MILRFTFFLLFIGASSISYSQNITKDTFGKGIKVLAADSSFSLRFGARFQTLFTAESITGNQTIDTKFMIRRSRLKFDGFIFSPKIKYKMEFGLSNRDISGAHTTTSDANRIILDAVLKWNFYKNFELWAGQTKLPGNRERVISSSKLQFVDRSLVNSKFNIDRDAGVQLRHYISAGDFIIREVFSVSNGEGRNFTADNIAGYDYTGRIEILPFGKFASKGDYFGSDLKRESKPKLAIGVSYDYNEGATRQRGQLGDYFDSDFAERDLKTVFADLMFKYNGLSIMAEYVNKTTSNPVVYLDELQTLKEGSFYTGSGTNLQMGYLFENNVELGIRYTNVVPEAATGRSELNQYTVGASKYVIGHSLKVQTDFTYLIEGTSPDELMFRLQFEMHL